nr:uncharacterized protein LOC111509606 [Leptinotarsa decemlineata]
MAIWYRLGLCFVTGPTDFLEKWMREIEKVSEIQISKCYSYLILSAIATELHTFCDSSEKAFTAVVYLRVVGVEETKVCLISAKTRVAPLKELSIPRLELQAEVMANRLSQLRRKELEIPINRTFFWSDSRCVLNWIRGDGKNYKPFVSHRMGEIQERTEVKDWYWVSTEYNIADEATRWTVGEKIISDQWFSGPHFLRQSEELWPCQKDMKYLCEVDVELKQKQFGTCLLITNHENCLPLVKRFSKWIRLIRSMAWCLRYINILKNKKWFKPNLTKEEISNAEKIWVQCAQQESLPSDICCLKNGKHLSGSSKLASLCPELKDGIMVLSGRTNLSKWLSRDVSQPAILNPNADNLRREWKISRMIRFFLESLDKRVSTYLIKAK